MDSPFLNVYTFIQNNYILYVGAMMVVYVRFYYKITID